MLVLHGFTGNPSSLRAIAEQLAAAGLSVELPLLPGHGTSVEDMATTTCRPTGRGRPRRPTSSWPHTATRVAVVGLSMGGTLACWLAEHHPDIAGLALVNPLVEPPADEVLELLGVAAGRRRDHGPGGRVGDIARPGVVESAYPEIP